MPVDLSKSLVHPFRVPPAANSDLAQRIQNKQEFLIERAERFLHGEPLSELLQGALLKTPRHQFAPRFQDGSPGLWSDVDDSLLIPQLDVLYADQPYPIFKNELGIVTSTISQPSLVLYMIHLLEIKPGQRVFELGGGSGWNAALMSHLVGPTGSILSYEIEDGLIANAQTALDQCGVQNVSLKSGDGTNFPVDPGSFDRGVFTASAWDLPECFFRAIKEDGLLLFVFRVSDSVDLLAALRRTGNHFTSELHFPCRFVPTTGPSEIPSEVVDQSQEQRFSDWLGQHGEDLEDLELQIHSASALPPPNNNAFDLTRRNCVFRWSPRGSNREATETAHRNSP